MNTEGSKIEVGVRPRRGGRWLWFVLAPALTLGAGLSVTAARAQDLGFADGGPGGGFMAHRMDRILDKVNASAAQRAQIQQIWNGLQPQLKTLHQQHAAIHKQMVAALTAATIDPNAVEQLRQQAVSVADKTSSVFTQGVVKTAQVLTADQRKLAQQELAQERQEHHHHHGQPEQQ
jgi:periplasmic protein CpxP/Spy